MPSQSHAPHVTDLKKDKAGLKEYTDYLDQLGKKKAELRKRIAASKQAIVSPCMSPAHGLNWWRC